MTALVAWLKADWVLVTAVVASLAAVVSNIDRIITLFDRVFRKRLSVKCLLTSDPEHGNTIHIANLTDRPVLISTWSVVWAKGLPPWFVRAENQEVGPEWDDDPSTPIAPHARMKLAFLDGNWFDWGVRHRDKGRLYLKIYLEGSKRPLWFHLHTPGK